MAVHNLQEKQGLHCVWHTTVGAKSLEFFSDYRKALEYAQSLGKAFGSQGTRISGRTAEEFKFMSVWLNEELAKCLRS